MGRRAAINFFCYNIVNLITLLLKMHLFKRFPHFGIFSISLLEVKNSLYLLILNMRNFVSWLKQIDQMIFLLIILDNSISDL